MNRQNKRIWLWIELLCLVFLACLLLGKGLLPGWRVLRTDFPNYYLVARLLHEGYSLDRIYDWIWLQRIKDHWGLDQPLVAFAGLTPLSALPILPVAGFAALTAKRFWIVANLLFLFGTVESMHRVTGLGRRRIWILSLLAIIPLRASFLLGQMHILVLFLMALAYFFRTRQKGIASGVCIALAGALKVYPLLFAFYFMWKKQWRAAFAIVCATAALVGIGYACMGSHLMHIYLTQVLPRSMQGEVIDPYNVRAASAAALFHRLFLFEPDLNAAPMWNRPLLYSIIYPLWQAILLFPLFLSIRPSATDRDTEKIEWAAFLVLLLVLSPVPSSYHFVVMILPIVLAADVLVKRKQYRVLALLLMLYCGICSVVISPARGYTGFSFWTVVAFSRLWIGMLLWLLLVIYLWRERSMQESRRAVVLRALQLAVVVGAFWVVGFTGYQRHFAYLAEDIRARLRLSGHPPLAIEIHPRTEGFIATVMSTSAESYKIIDQNGEAVLSAGNADQLSSAAAAAHPLTLIELADAHGSRIVSGDAASTLVIPNAESPAISPDGSALIYIREEKGRGTLWTAHITSSSDGLTVAGETALIGKPYDVRDAAFTPSGAITFTARINDKTNIYKIEPGAAPAVLIMGEDEAEYGAISPDGQWIVYRRLLHNRWQLVLMNLSSRVERQLTLGDCNAFAPAWMSATTIAYSTDCGRGLGLPALASMNVGFFVR